MFKISDNLEKDMSEKAKTKAKEKLTQKDSNLLNNQLLLDIIKLMKTLVKFDVLAKLNKREMYS